MVTLDATHLIVAIIGSNAIFAFIQFLITRHDNKKEKQSNETKGMRDMILGLGHDKLLYLTDKFAERGGITQKERRNLKYLYDPYIRLGGNGDCQIGYETCEKLQTLTDDEAAILDGRMKRKEYGIEE